MGEGGDGRPTSWRQPTALLWSRTIEPEESTGSGTWADNRRPIPQPARVAVLRARSGQAADKGLVEACVGAVQSRILLALRHQTFFSLDAMNAAIRRELDRLNHALMACGETRRAVFEANERAVLQPLPRAAESGASGSTARSRRTAMCASNATTTRCPTAMSASRSTRASASAWSKCSSNGAATSESIAVHPRKSGRNQYARRILPARRHPGRRAGFDSFPPLWRPLESGIEVRMTRLGGRRRGR